MNNLTRKIDPINLYVGSRIKKRRNELGITTTELGALLREPVSHVQIINYEKGYNGVPLSKLHELAVVLKVNVPYFLEGFKRVQDQVVNISLPKTYYDSIRTQ
jgi:transcriptional regulator with XRE-family HTH domain